LLSKGLIQNPCCPREVDQGDVSPDEPWDAAPNIVHLGKRFKKRDQFEKTAVVRIIVPTQDRDGILRVEEVRVRRVVDNNNVFHRPSQQREVLDVGALEGKAVLSVQPHGDQYVLIESVDEGVRVDAH
jgi:hypothetical protein